MTRNVSLASVTFIEAYRFLHKIEIKIATMEVMKMDEPISRKTKHSNKSRSHNSSLKSNKVDQTEEIEKLKKDLSLAQEEKLTLQKQLSTAMKEGTEHQEKLADLTKTLKELQKKHDALKPKSPVKTKPKESKPEEVLKLQQKVRNLEEKNRILEETVAELGKKITEKAKNETIDTSEEGMREVKSSARSTENSLDTSVEERRASNREKEFHKVMCEYEELLRRVLTERQNLIEEKNFAQNELSKLIQAYDELMDKYNRAKEVVEGFGKNEQLMRKQMEDWTKMLISFGKKYTDLKAYAEKKISQANIAMMNKDKGNIEEVAKLKAKILQSQVKITELQKQVGPKEMRGESLFAPLKNNLKKKQ